MIRHKFTRTAFFTCISLLVVGLANADVMQCVDGQGAVTYTNVPCDKGVGDATNYRTGTAPAVEPGIAAASPDITILGSSHDSAWVKIHTSKRSGPLDVETMKAARSSLLAIDRASHYTRRQNVIALDQRNGKWFDFQ